MGAIGKVGTDGLRVYLSGATSDGGVQPYPAASWGFHRSSTEASALGFLYSGLLSGIRIERISGANGVGVGMLAADGADSLTWQPPDVATPGTAVALAYGETRPMFGPTDKAKYIRVTRMSAASLVGSAQLSLARQYNNALGMEDVATVDATAGEDYYRCLFVKNHLEYEVAPIVYLVLQGSGSRYTELAGGLPGSGAGTITCKVAVNDFADWPASGWVRISAFLGGLREIAYYSSRTDTVLTVPATGRARLGTSAGAGVEYDVLNPLPGIRIAIDTPSSKLGGFVQAIPDANTEPIGRSWVTPISYASGLALGSLEPDEIMAFWVHMEIPTDCEPSPRQQHALALASYMAD